MLTKCVTLSRIFGFLLGKECLKESSKATNEFQNRSKSAVSEQHRVCSFLFTAFPFPSSYGVVEANYPLVFWTILKEIVRNSKFDTKKHSKRLSDIAYSVRVCPHLFARKNILLTLVSSCSVPLTLHWVIQKKALLRLTTGKARAKSLATKFSTDTMKESLDSGRAIWVGRVFSECIWSQVSLVGWKMTLPD